MYPVVRSVWCPDIDLTGPPAAESTKFSVPLRFVIAPSTGGAAEAFDVLVCSIEWLQHHIQLSGPRTGAGLLIVDTWEIPDAVRILSRRIVTTSADSWPELRASLATFMTPASASRAGEMTDDLQDLTELHLPPSEPRLCASPIAMVGALVYDFPALTEVLQDFVDAFEEVLPHVLMPDIIEFIGRNGHETLARGVLGWLDTAYAWGDADQRNLIHVSAVNAIPAPGEPGSHLRDLLGPHLRRGDLRLNPNLDARDHESSHRFQIASFVGERDGLALELVDAVTGETIAEVFRDDSDETASSRPLTFQCFASQPLDLALVEALLRAGRLELDLSGPAYAHDDDLGQKN